MVFFTEAVVRTAKNLPRDSSIWAGSHLVGLRSNAIEGTISKRTLAARKTPAKVQSDPADSHGKNDKDNPKGKGQRQVTLARFKCNRCRHRSGVTLNISAHDYDGSDLGNGPAKRSEKCSEHPITTDVHQGPEASKAGRPVI